MPLHQFFHGSKQNKVAYAMLYSFLIHVRDIIANHRPRFPWIISRNHPSHPQTLRVLGHVGDPSAPELVLMLIQAPVHWGRQVHTMSVDGWNDYAIQSMEIEPC